MRPSEARAVLARFSAKPLGFGKVAGLVVAAAIAGTMAGWILHNAYWRSSDIDYALHRALYLAATCKGIPLSEQIRRVEERIGKPLSQAKLDDKLIAIDYAFDRIEVSICIPR